MYGQRPYGTAYCETDREVVRGPCDTYSSEYNVREYATPIHSTGYGHHSHGGYVDTVTEIAYESVPGRHHHHHHNHGGVAEVIERKEVVYDSNCDPCRRSKELIPAVQVNYDHHRSSSYGPDSSTHQTGSAMMKIKSSEKKLMKNHFPCHQPKKPSRLNRVNEMDPKMIDPVILKQSRGSGSGAYPEKSKYRHVEVERKFGHLVSHIRNPRHLHHQRH